MRALAKSAKIHPATKKCCGWDEPAIDELFTDFKCLDRYRGSIKSRI